MKLKKTNKQKKTTENYVKKIFLPKQKLIIYTVTGPL